MKGPRPRRRGARLRPIAAAVALVLPTGLLAVPPAAAAVADYMQQVVDRSVAAAASEGIGQSISVVDRRTGELVADSGGHQQYISESIVKLFTVAYYLTQAGGHPDRSMEQTLRTMIVRSDDDIESTLWNVDIVPSMAARYGLADTRNGPKTGPQDWGWELITADDETKFLDEVSNDPEVAPLLMDAMAQTAQTGADGTNQAFGMNSLTGDHGSKQGWTDFGAGWSRQAQIHSVGWTDRYFVAILETTDDSSFDEMTKASTIAAGAVFRAEGGTQDSTSPAPATTAAPTPTGDPPASRSELSDLIPGLQHELDVLMSDLTALFENW